MTSRELVIATLHHESPARIPVDLWCLPATRLKYGEDLERIIADAQIDIVSAPFADKTEDPRHFMEGSYTDCWGSTWYNRQAGIIGEVKHFPLADISKIGEYVAPKDLFLSGLDGFEQTAAFISQHRDTFILGGWISLFERMQFLRGTENLFMDTVMETPEYYKLMEIVADYYDTYLDAWLKQDVDAIVFGDDWGSQRSLLISPDSWRKQFKPLYRRFFDKVHESGKYVFMHSDGYILEIVDDLVEIGVDALNSQIWCMGLDAVAEKCNGRITNWGEICRQHILPHGTPDDVIAAVDEMKSKLWKNGGLIGQFEAGPDMPLENIKAGLTNWNKNYAGISA